MRTVNRIKHSKLHRRTRQFQKSWIGVVADCITRWDLINPEEVVPNMPRQVFINWRLKFTYTTRTRPLPSIWCQNYVLCSIDQPLFNKLGTPCTGASKITSLFSIPTCLCDFLRFIFNLRSPMSFSKNAAFAARQMINSSKGRHLSFFPPKDLSNV